MWLNHTDYKDLDKLYPLIKQLQDIIVKPNGLLLHDKFNNVVRPAHHDPKVKWYSIVLYQMNKDFDFAYVDSRFDEVIQSIKQIPSIIQAVINYIGPNSITPLHKDSKSCDDVEGSQKHVPTYQLMLGIYTPKGDIGLKFIDDARSWGDGDILAFDGETPHCGWNNTNDYRIALYLDVTKESFNVY